MKKTIKLLIGLLLITNAAAAQKNTWTIGFYTGVQGQMLMSVERNYYSEAVSNVKMGYIRTDIRTIHTISIYPPMELCIQYNITSNFSFSTGIGYINYLSQWKSNYASGYEMDRFALNTFLRSASLQIPCAIRYDIPLKSTGFFIIPKLGLNMDFFISELYYRDIDLFSQNSAYYNDVTYNSSFEVVYGMPTNSRKFNLLLNAGVGFAYRFNSGLGLSLSGEYNIGTMRVEQCNYKLQLKDPATGNVDYEFDYLVHNRNEYWNVLLGVSYTFKKKDKK
jgi:hypothetical protein